jgi:hypothetical protein
LIKIGFDDELLPSDVQSLKIWEGSHWFLNFGGSVVYFTTTQRSVCEQFTIFIDLV